MSVSKGKKGPVSRVTGVGGAANDNAGAGGARVLMADPPWSFGDKLPGPGRGAVKHYSCMSVAEIEAFKLPPLAADGCLLLLWRVSAMQEEALRVMRAWGFVPKSEIVWRKQTSGGNRWFGMGRYVRAEHETCLIGVRGRVAVADRSIRSVFDAPASVHSAKPDRIYEIAEALVPGGPYVELFARRERAGWQCFGDAVPTAYSGREKFGGRLIPYFGGKTRMAKLYPVPEYPTIYEPFAGGAAYALRYRDRNVVLVDKDPDVVELWDYAINASPADILRLPIVQALDELPDRVPRGARLLIGWWFDNHTARASSRMCKRGRGPGDHQGPSDYWSVGRRERLAALVSQIKHWRVLLGDYSQLDPSTPATWFVDPPYAGGLGELYRYKGSALDFGELGAWCCSLRGQVIVCEAAGAEWLPFVSLPGADAKRAEGHSFRANKPSRDVVWIGGAA